MSNRDEVSQEREIIEAAIAHVVANGPCDNMDADEYDAEGNPYCDDAECTYCALSRSMDGYHG